MRKIIIAALLGGSALLCSAQSSRFPSINLYAGDPTGNPCTGNTILQSSTNGLLYTCQGGTMKATGGGSSSAPPNTNFLGSNSTGTLQSAPYAPLNPNSNLSDLASPSAARANLGLGTAALASMSSFLQPSNNLNDLGSAATARTNLGLGSAATQPSSAFDPAGAATTAAANSVQRSGDTMSGTLSVPGLPGYTPPGGAFTPFTMNRDNFLSLYSRPEDLGAQGNGDMSHGDECRLIWQKELLAFQNYPGTTKTIDLWHNYRCTRASAMAILPHDHGDYNPAGLGTGAQVGLTVVNGVVTGCSVSGGTGYAPSSNLPVLIQDFSNMGSGAHVHAVTNSSGVPSSCTVDLGGMNYPTMGTLTTVLPARGDGATGTIALTSGTFATTWTATTGGGGYSGTPTSGVPVGTSLVQCSSYPNLVTTVSSGAVTGGTSTTGSGCTYNGVSTATVPVCIGACTNGAQATNIAQETVTSIGIAIPLLPGITIDCHGNSIQTDYWQGTADLNQLVVFGDPWGVAGLYGGAQSITVKNCNIGGFGGFWFSGPTRDVVLDHDTFMAQPLAVGFGNLGSASGSTFGVYMAQAGSGTVISNSLFLTNAGVICGGQWTSRAGGNGGNGSLGGMDESQKALGNNSWLSTWGGSCDGLTMVNDDLNSVQAQAAVYTAQMFPPAVNNSTSQNAYNLALDNFFRDNVWKINNSSLTNISSSFGTGLCYGTQTAFSNRAIDWKFGNLTGNTSNQQSNPFNECYRGVSDMGLVAISRSGHLSQVSVNGIQITGGYRPAVLGNFTHSTFINVGTNGQLNYTDPYLPASTKPPGVVEVHGNTTPLNTFLGIRNMGTPTQINNRQNTVYVTTLAAQDYSGSVWNGITSTNGQSTYNAPSPAVAAITSGSIAGTTISTSTLAASNTYQGGTVSGTYTGVPIFKDANGNTWMNPQASGSWSVIASGSEIQLDGSKTYQGNATSSNTFVAPGNNGTFAAVRNHWYNGTSDTYAEWTERDTSNTTATVVPTGINRVWQCGTSCLPYFDAVTWPTGSTLVWNGLTSRKVSGYQLDGTIYSAAGTALPTCASGIKGATAIVSDATSPTYMGAYTSGGAVTAGVVCSYNGTTYSWLTH